MATALGNNGLQTSFPCAASGQRADVCRQSSLERFRERVKPLEIAHPATADDADLWGPGKPLDVLNIDYDKIFPSYPLPASSPREIPISPLANPSTANHQDFVISLSRDAPCPSSTYCSRAAPSPPFTLARSPNAGAEYCDLRSRVLGCPLGTPRMASVTPARRQSLGAVDDELFNPQARVFDETLIGRARFQMHSSGQWNRSNSEDCPRIAQQRNRSLTKQVSEPRMGGRGVGNWAGNACDDGWQGWNGFTGSFSMDAATFANIVDTYLGLDDSDDELAGISGERDARRW